MGPYVEGFRVSLLASGYAPGSVRHMLKDMGGLGQWMDCQGIAASDLNRAAIEVSEQLSLAASSMYEPKGAATFTELVQPAPRWSINRRAGG
jgi:hypothetical protein